MKRLIIIVFIIFSMISFGFSKNCGGDITCECGDIVTSSYTMSQDLYCEGEGLLLRNNLDCASYSIYGSGIDAGLILDVVNKKTIQNCRVENFSYGVKIGAHELSDRAYYNDFINLSIEHNEVGVYLGEDHVSTSLTNSIFKDNGISIQALASPKTLVVNNTFHDTLFDYKSSSMLNLCDLAYENTYLGEQGTTCSCFVPLDGMKFNTDEKLCKDDYIFSNGIEIRSRANLNCRGSRFIGNESGVGLKGSGAEYTTVSNCHFLNYSKGAFYTHESRKNKYYGSYLQISKNNLLSNISISDVDIGVEFDYSSRYGTSRVEHITHSSLEGREFIFKNIGSSFLHAINNSYGTNNEVLIEDLFYDSSRINYQPFKQIHKMYNFSFGNFQQIENTLVLELLSEDKLLDTVELEIYLEVDGEVQEKILKYANFSYSRSAEVYIPILGNINSISVFVKREQDFLNTTISSSPFFLSLDEKYFLETHNFSLEDDSLVKNFLMNDIFISEDSLNSYRTLKLSFGNIASSLPYAFDLISTDSKIEILANSSIGMYAALEYFLEHKRYLEKNSISITSRTENVDAKLLYDFSENYNFSLFDDQLTYLPDVDVVLEEELVVEVSFEDDIIPYSVVKKKVSTPSQSYEFLTPIVMSGGLWSNRKSFDYFSEELAKRGYLVYLLEMNGGEHLECDSCFNYEYLDLYSSVFPSLVSFVLEDSNSSNIIYVGHSNGGRTVLDSIASTSVDSQIIHHAILLGVPGAFQDLSLFAQLIKERGKLALDEFYEENLFHISQGDVAHAFSNYGFFSSLDLTLDIVGIYMNYDSPIKISTNLFSKYVSWIVSQEDKQPGEVYLNSVMMVSGNPKYLQENDIIVSTKDMEAIFDSIISENKKYYELKTLHFDMTANKEILSLIIDSLEELE